MIEEFEIEIGDEIAVFDEELCVGAVVFDGIYPINLAAWKDDIATPEEIDGYDGPDEMIFKIYDQSENTEITFELPPQTASVSEDDPRFPTHSGFGIGICAKRSLTNGLTSVNQLPKQFVLGQNYPNPFNEETVIPLSLPERSRIKIQLYDLLGRRVSDVFKGVRNAGHVNIKLNASLLASGVYFYYVEAEGIERGGKFKNVGKLLLLK